MTKVEEVNLTDLVPDTENANRGTERGQKMIEDSLVEDGPARSVVVDKKGNVVAGNKTLKAAKKAGIDKGIVVEVAGTELVITKRTDWDLESDEAPRRYAYRDNRAGELSLDWDPEQVLADIDIGIDLSGMFSENELNTLKEQIDISNIEFPEYDEAIEDEVEYIECPHCGEKFPK